jgi:anti-sigma regulatory factor (Ser/Thr protein kinase)
MAGSPVSCASDGGYVHEAFFYRGDEEFLSGCVEFLADGLRNGEYAVVAVLPEKVRRLRAALGERADQVTFIDMAAAGRNPGRIIQLWRDLVDAAEERGLRVRGIGEPIWQGRTDEELLEAELHEALLNQAFEEEPLRLRCPYDVTTLAPEVVATARTTHPTVVQSDGARTSWSFSPATVVDTAFTEPLGEPAEVEVDRVYGVHDLVALRRVTLGVGRRHRLEAEALDALVLAVREIAANSIRHGGGTGRLRIWVDGPSLVCELRDAGHISESMVGRLRPRPESEDGRGVWLAHQLCDLVQIRSTPLGTVIRLHVAIDDAP